MFKNIEFEDISIEKWETPEFPLDLDLGSLKVNRRFTLLISLDKQVLKVLPDKDGCVTLPMFKVSDKRELDELKETLLRDASQYYIKLNRDNFIYLHSESENKCGLAILNCIK